jgi:tRNA A-37 threonylcarbamoyl transferase component Bud32
MVSPHDAQRVAGRYSLFEQLGAGGTAVVHRARDEATGRIVALKRLLSSLAGKHRALLEALFEREYHTLVRLKHPRIIEVYDYGLSESGPYYTMELLEGADLQQLSPMPFEQVCRHLRDLASSLALIHSHRLLHRDITPRNLRVTPDGRCKLIDFGALTGFGPAKELVATPAYSAPEVLRRLSLDQRSDLFALGAVGYFALTGRHAFNAERADLLEALWLKAPLAPSKLVADVPPALDSLILSLLSVDSLARPSSAAAVIDRLNALAGLPAEDELAAESYLSSGRMVGRAKELAWGRARVARALTGNGASVVLEGAAGVGKTRLLDEMALEAQLRGMIVLKADAQAMVGPFGVAAALSLQLLSNCSELARREAQPHAPLLGLLHPELCEKLDNPAPATLPSTPSERHALFQHALREWFVAVAMHRPLLLAMDNLQALDDSSATFLVGLSGRASDAPLMLLATQRHGGSSTVKLLRKRSSRLKLAGFDLLACEDFVKSLFGEVDGTGRVARVFFENSAGNPQHCMDLARLMVQRKIAKYAAGTWVLPLQLFPQELPSRMEEIVAGKLADLPADARELVEALSIYTRPVSIERALQSSERVRRPDALAALDQLVAAQILFVEGDQYRFAQQSVGAAVLAQLDAVGRRSRHLHAAEALLSGDSTDLALRMDAGWHLLHGGADRRGADLLAETARAYLKAQFATETADQIALALEAAIEVYERQKRSDCERAELLFPLVTLGYYCTDWRTTPRYAMRAAQLALRLTGLGLAQKLRPFLGKRLALWFGQGLARLRGARERMHGRAFDLRAMLVSFGAMLPPALGSLCVCIDVASAHALIRLFEPLDLLPSHPFISLVRSWSKAMLLTLVGRERESLEAYALVYARLRDPQLVALVGEGRRTAMLAGCLNSQALLECYCASPHALELAQEMEQLGVRLWALSANQVRRLHHAYRGEIAQAQRFHEGVELFASEGSTTWQSEMFWPAALLDAHMLSADVMATRHTWEQLARQAKQVVSLRVYADAAQAAYLTLRGELGAAIELYQTLLPALPARRGMSWLPTRSYFAQALNLAGQHARARQVLLDALADTHPKDQLVAMHFSEARRQLALAEAGLGNYQAASSLLDALFEAYGPLDNPLLLGLFHKARAEVALRARDRASFDLQLERVDHYFRATDNPALIAQCEQLAEQAVRAGFRRSLEPKTGAPQSLEPVSIDSALAALGAATNRNDCALRLTLQRARGKSGYLYLFLAGELQPSAAIGGTSPPTEILAKLEASIVRFAADDDDEDGMTTAMVPNGSSGAPAEGVLTAANTNYEVDSDHYSDAEPGSTVFIHSTKLRAEDGYHPIVLSTRRSGKRVVVGGLILEMSAADLFRLDQHFQAVIAEALCEQAIADSA